MMTKNILWEKYISILVPQNKWIPYTPLRVANVLKDNI